MKDVATLHGLCTPADAGLKYAACLGDGWRAVTLSFVVLPAAGQIEVAMKSRDAYAWTAQGIPFLPANMAAHWPYGATVGNAQDCVFVAEGRCVSTKDYANALAALQTWLIDGSDDMLATVLKHYWGKVFGHEPRQIITPDSSLLLDALEEACGHES